MAVDYEVKGKAALITQAQDLTDTTDWAQLNSLWEAALKTFGPRTSPAARDQAGAAIGSYHIFNVNTVGPIRLVQIAIDNWLQKREIKGNLLWDSSMDAYIPSIQPTVVKSLQGLNQLTCISNSVICPGPESCRDRLPLEDIAVSSEDPANAMFALLTEEQYGNGNALEMMMVGSKEAPVIHQKKVRLEALYPTASPMGAGTKAMGEERSFMKMVAEKGRRPAF
ncbi:hypothetical protein LX36DRAFT_681829 [Colletotrichum falcatum]|nr:hypothetical protein LX36DRAFT_681829 [Colletotrichum falcatum]